MSLNIICVATQLTLLKGWIPQDRFDVGESVFLVVPYGALAFINIKYARLV